MRAQKLETLKRALARGLGEDLGEEDIFGLVLGFEVVATDGDVGSSASGLVSRVRRGAEGGGTYSGSCRPVVVLTAFGGREAFESPEPVEGLDNFLGVGQDGDEVGLEAGAGSLPGFELAIEDEGGIGESFSREAEGGAKEDLGRPAPGQRH